AGNDANGVLTAARVRASRLCWDANSQYRRLAWFGETVNIGDSMGGWTGSSRNHLDHDPLRYSVGTGWNATNLSAPNPCDVDGDLYSCTIAESDHIYIDTNR
ncbi:MAG TPA: hypothetical protein VFK38_07440, partial [Candidatus Limnocylindrales bacterium]|nr:hypothetical protein [Candidatus Limnocylindrales bacterium]